MDVDEHDEIPVNSTDDVINDEETFDSPQKSSSDTHMDVDSDNEMDTPRISKKRSRHSMTPHTGDGIRKKTSQRLIATKRTGSPSSMDLTGGDDEEVDTPRRSGKSKSRERIKQRSPGSPKSEGVSSSQSLKSHASIDTLDEDSVLGSKPFRKKPKRRELINPVPLTSPATSPVKTWPAPNDTSATAAKPTENIWQGFISRSIQKLKNIGSTPVKREVPPPNMDYRVNPDTSSEPNADVAYEEAQYSDFVGSPNYRTVSSSAPQGMGSPASFQSPNTYAPPQYTPQTPGSSSVYVRQGNEIYQRSKVEFTRSSSTEDHFKAGPSNDYIDSRSYSAGPMNSPIRPNLLHSATVPQTNSPTAYLASPHAPTTSDWSLQHTRSPIRMPRNETWVSPAPPPTGPSHPPKHARRNSLDLTTERKPKKPSLLEEVKKALKSFMFAVVVVFLLVLIVWLFTGDMWHRLFSSDPLRLTRMCAHNLKELLRRRRGEYDCHVRDAPSMTNSEMDMLISSSCPYEKEGMSARAVKEMLYDDWELTREVKANSIYYNGPSPSKPILCAIKHGALEFVKANALYMSFGVLVIVAFFYLLYRIKRWRSDKELAKNIAHSIIEQLKQEHADKGGTDAFLVKDYMEDDYGKTAAEKRVWPQVVDLVEANIRVRTVPKLVHGDQLVTWVWS